MRALRIRERLRAGLVRKRAILMRERVRIKLFRVSVEFRSLEFDVSRWVEQVDDWIIDVVPGRQTDDGLGRLAGDEAEASVIADEVHCNPCFAKVFADGREIRDLEDSASDVVHLEIVMNLLEVGMHVNANLVHEKRVSCCLVADSDELFEHCRRSLLVVGPGCTTGIIQEGEYLGKDEGVALEQIHVQAMFSVLEDLKALRGRELALGVLKKVRVGVVLDQNRIRRHRHLNLLKVVLRAGAHLDDSIWKRVECFD